jgi:hypothetical protein
MAHPRTLRYFSPQRHGNTEESRAGQGSAVRVRECPILKLVQKSDVDRVACADLILSLLLCVYVVEPGEAGHYCQSSRMAALCLSNEICRVLSSPPAKSP